MKRLALLVLCINILGCGSAGFLYPTQYGPNEYGYINKKGQMVLSGYRSVGEFRSGLALVRINDDAVYVNEHGKIVIEERHNWIFYDDFADGLARVLVSLDDAADFDAADFGAAVFKVGFMNTDGDMVISPQYDRYIGEDSGIGTFSDGLCVFAKEVSDGGEEIVLYGYIDKKGECIIDPKYKKAGDFSCGLAPVLTDDDWSIIDTNGATVAKGYVPIYGYRDGYCLARTDKNQNVLLDRMGERHAYEYEIWQYSEGLIPARKDNKWGYIDIDGNVVIPFKYEMALPFHEGHAIVVLGGISGFIKKDGSVLFMSPSYEAHSGFSDGVGVVKGEDGLYYINEDGLIIGKVYLR